jgi:tight adherence protein C
MTSELWITLVAVFGCVALLTGLATSWMFARTSPQRRRLEALARAAHPENFDEAALVTPEPEGVMSRLATVVPRSPATISRLRLRMVRAGLYSNRAVATYTVAQLAVPLAAALAAFLLLPTVSWPAILLAAVVGYQVPSFWLHHRMTRRQLAIRNALPDALDLMIVCLESGLALDQTIVKVSEELRLSYPALAYELQLLIQETRAGEPRLDAFRNLAERTGVADVRSLVAMLVQTDRFGTSVSRALRTHADTARTRRRQRAEEAAAKIGVKLAFPLVLFLFPAFFIFVQIAQ